jgi:protein-disulfide isomerase
MCRRFLLSKRFMNQQTRRSKTRIGLLTLAVAWAASSLPAGATPSSLPDEVQEVGVESWNPSRGPANAPVTLVVFAEYQCPFSQRLEAVLARVRRAYGDRVRIVRRQFIVHPTAERPALAAIAAEMQGKFGALHERLFANMQELRSDDGLLDRLAEQAGLDVER